MLCIYICQVSVPGRTGEENVLVASRVKESEVVKDYVGEDVSYSWDVVDDTFEEYEAM